MYKNSSQKQPIIKVIDFNHAKKLRSMVVHIDFFNSIKSLYLLLFSIWSTFVLSIQGRDKIIQTDSLLKYVYYDCLIM